MTSGSSEPRFKPGDKVRLKSSGRRGLVYQATQVGDGWQYEVLLFGSDTTEVFAERYLTEDVSDDSVEARIRQWRFIDADQFRQALTTLKLRRPLEQNLYSYLASRTDLQPYQFKPVLKLLRSPYGSMFIADEVGLGKTIEAGIVMTELAARRPELTLPRVLVCCPPALLGKWEAELRERFDQDFEIVNRERALTVLADPHSALAPAKVIASLALLRQRDIIEAIADSETRFDLVIVDESHAMQNPETLSHRLGEQLSSVADFMLFLSATPLSLSTANLFHQLSILVPEEFFDPSEFDSRIAPNRFLNQAIRALRRRPAEVPAALGELRRIALLDHGPRFADNPLFLEVCRTLESLDGQVDDETRMQLEERINELNTIGHVFTRTRKREVQDQFPARRPHTIRVELSPAEEEFYDAVTDFVRRNAGGIASFATIMPQRQVASSIPAARDYLDERWGGMSALVEEETAAELELEVEEGRLLPELPPDVRLRRAWQRSAGVDSKFAAFTQALDDLAAEGTARDGKVLLFSFFRKTIEHLARGLRGRDFGGRPLRVSILYGPTPKEERSRIVEAFRNEPGPHILLSSEVAAEGLDFEFVNVMVNYDLPWNPMRVEQRIGRLDRYGQQEKVIHIFNFSVRDTIEERILERLYERIGIFESAIGDLESILGNEIEDLTRELLQPGLTPEEENDLIAQAAENIVRRKLDAERFESESRNLLGQDDIFSEQLNRLEREKRYLGPEEIKNFVSVGLRSHFPRVRLSESEGRTTVLRIPAGEDALREAMAAYLNRRSERSGRAWRAIPRAQGGNEWRVTFNPEVATRARDLDFITLQHPLVGALLEREPAVVTPVAALRITGRDRVERRFAFFIFLLNIHRFREGLEFLPVAVELGGDVDEELSDELLVTVQGAETWLRDDGYPDENEVAAALEQATVWAATRIAERQADLERVSDQIIERRIDSLQESHGRWREHRQRMLEEAQWRGDERMARLHHGYMRRRDNELQTKLTQLAEQRGVEIGQELLAGGVLKLEPPGRPHA